MDATNDVIAATICNYSWRDCKNYAVSLAQSGFRGRKVMFVNNITTQTREALLTLGFELVDFEIDKDRAVVVQRFLLLHDWLENEPNVRFVIHCDVRDVVVQSNPSPWMEKQTAKIFAASEFILYKDESCNPRWVRRLYDEQTKQSLLREEVICAGTVAGEADAVKRLALRIYESSTGLFGDDQAALNVLLRNEFKDEMRIPTADEGFIMTSGWWLIGSLVDNYDRPVGLRSKLCAKPPKFEDGVVYPNGSDVPYCIVHQYERGPAWASTISQHYKSDFEVEEDQPVAQQVWVRSGTGQYASDGMTVDWFDTHKRI